MSQDQDTAQSPEREALRVRHGVRAVTSAEEGHDVKALPAGVYGFTAAPAAPELPLFTQAIVRSTEVHKTASGEIYLIGYVQPAEAEAIRARVEPLRVNLFPEPRDASETLVAIPLLRIDRRLPPTRDNGNAMAVEVAPAG